MKYFVDTSIYVDCLRKDALKKTLDLLIPVTLINIDRDIALDGGRIYSSLVKDGEEIELNDCLIAAAAMSVGVYDIVTRNTKHFERIKDIRPITPEELGFE